jgi:beta-glucosidase
VVPSGKLAMSWPRSVGHQPACYSRQTGSANWPYVDSPFDPVFPFGHGLSYTTFKYGKVSLSSGTIRTGASIDVSVELTNIGTRSGMEVVQLYVTGQYFGIVRPKLELKGFTRVTLEPGKSETVTLKLDAEDLMFHDAGLKRVLPAGGEFLVSVGGSSAVRTKPVVLKVGN